MQSLTEIKNQNELDAALKQVDEALEASHDFANKDSNIPERVAYHIRNARSELFWARNNLATAIAMSRRVQA